MMLRLSWGGTLVLIFEEASKKKEKKKKEKTEKAAHSPTTGQTTLQSAGSTCHFKNHSARHGRSHRRLLVISMKSVSGFNEGDLHGSGGGGGEWERGAFFFLFLSVEIEK